MADCKGLLGPTAFREFEYVGLLVDKCLNNS